MSFKFRNWQVYKDLRNFRQDVLREILPKFPKDERFELEGQLRRALNSTVLNVAEGAYRKSDKDLAHFLNQADTSLNEVIACFDLCLDDQYIDIEMHSRFLEKSRGLTAQLAGFRKFLKNSLN